MASRRTNANRSKTRRRKRQKTPTYNAYIRKVLKDVDEPRRISSKALEIMNHFVEDMFGRIVTEASRLAKYNNKTTLTTREIRTATRLVVPGELGRYATTMGSTAVLQYHLSWYD